MALDINTGKRVWSYQTVHHDFVGYGSAVAADAGRYVDAKTASFPRFCNRPRPEICSCSTVAPGKLIVPAPERPVPQGAAPGDHVAPTQPFSELTFRPEQKLTGADMWGATIFDQLACRILFHQMRYEGTFTPPSLQGYAGVSRQSWHV